MAKSNSKCRVCSHESSVSSLLSCSLSGDNSSNSDGSFRYKDKLYSSASQALQAYIDDYDLSQMYPSANPGKSNTDNYSASVPGFSKHTYKPKNALENLDHRKSSLSYRREIINDLDSVSLTTDDLLKLPADGSFSFTYVGPGNQIHKKNKKCTSRLNLLDTERNKSVQEPAFPMGKNNLVTPVVYTNTNGKQCGRLKSPKVMNKANRCSSEAPVCFAKKLPSKDRSEHSLEKNYPRWLTSQKSDLNVSGITSIPDFKYPVWLHNEDLLPDTKSERIHKVCKEDQNSPSYRYQAERTSRLPNTSDCFECSFDSSNVLNSLSDDKGLVNGYECDCGQNSCHCGTPLLGQSKEPFSGDKIELLILKAKKNLEPCTEELPKPTKKDDSPCSLDKLEAERSWENIPVAFKSPVPVNCDDSPQTSRTNCANRSIEEFLEDNQSCTLSGGKHHGPVEALKQMLFNLQAVQESFNQNKTTEKEKETKQVLEDDFSKLQLKETMIPITKSLQNARQATESIRYARHSNNKVSSGDVTGPARANRRSMGGPLPLPLPLVALHHLSRLRDLVDDTSGKQSPKM